MGLRRQLHGCGPDRLLPHGQRQPLVDDVLASAAGGTGIGILVPWLHRAGPGCMSYQVLPAPGGLAITGEF